MLRGNLEGTQIQILKFSNADIFTIGRKNQAMEKEEGFHSSRAILRALRKLTGSTSCHRGQSLEVQCPEKQGRSLSVVWLPSPTQHPHFQFGAALCKFPNRGEVRSPQLGNE